MRRSHEEAALFVCVQHVRRRATKLVFAQNDAGTT